MKYIWRLLKQHISWAQLIGFFIASWLGMSIILLGLQFYQDITPVFRKDTRQLLKKEFLIVSKQVTATNMLQSSSATFSASELADFEKQPFLSRLEYFQASQYSVYATIALPLSPIQIGSEIFFESIKDEYLDVVSERWKFDEKSKFIPIVLPRNYLNLYNFGYAQARHLPRLSQDVLGQIGMNIQIRGNGYSDIFTGQIVGFSDRINTILVPYDFMQWSNKRYSREKFLPARLLIEVNNPADERIANYCQTKRYEIENNASMLGKMSYLMRIGVFGLIVVGIFISALAFYLLLLSIFLLLQKNQEKLRNLLLIGYLPSKVAQPYQWLAWGISSLVFALAMILVIFIQSQYIETLERFYPATIEVETSFTFALGWGCLLYLLLLVFSGYMIKYKILKLLKE